MPAEPSTLADLRKAGIISSIEIVAAIDAYMRDSTVGPYRFASGHSLDIAAIVAGSPAFQMVERSGTHENAFRVVLAAAVMAAHPTLP
ncbi:hypothetical protein [Methylobacterium radiotolerans]|uniref:hypothetical protein n=1 Tax=Methylobacterium radiotolerans TaxID=31998 RepID=UPI001F300D98|nr:hypothetical protein [Methylobacterium radiotolerans]UIY45616.1 hypothetical protein LZ599_31125 [Methylobacterium radiotolerans]UIY45781.1 hypothetical protein LZ599_32005 [Methylobacterium radiotolerans]